DTEVDSLRPSGDVASLSSCATAIETSADDTSTHERGPGPTEDFAENGTAATAPIPMQ
ncbi:hypothetical protein FHG87_023927, partial [Trinorchestia longiramus]